MPGPSAALTHDPDTLTSAFSALTCERGTYATKPAHFPARPPAQAVIRPSTPHLPRPVTRSAGRPLTLRLRGGLS